MKTTQKAGLVGLTLIVLGSLVGESNGAVIAGDIDVGGYTGSVELLSTTYNFSFDVDVGSVTRSRTYEATFSPHVTTATSFLRGSVNDLSVLSSGVRSHIDHYFRRGSIGGVTGYRNDAMLGSDNYLLVDLNSSGTFETVLQYNFATSSGELVSILTSSDDSSLNISGGIDSVVADPVSAIPEASSIILLGLGAFGAVVRRSRTKQVG